MARKFSFAAGIRLPLNKKRTESESITQFPMPEKVLVPLETFGGASPYTVVRKGDTVVAGERVGEPTDFNTLPVFASISGEITAVTETFDYMGKVVPAVEITSDFQGKSKTLPPISDWKERSPIEILDRIRDCGVFEQGSTPFPTHIKLAPSPEKKIDTLIINGAESEPLLTSDHRIMLERTHEFIQGTLIAQYTVRAKKTLIGIEKNKPDVIASVKAEIERIGAETISVIALESKFPQQHDTFMVRAVTKRIVPSGKKAEDTGCVVLSCGSASSIYNAVVKGIPLYERTVTISGELVKRPGNYTIPTGTSIRSILEHCDTDLGLSKKVICGGPMTGTTIASVDIPFSLSINGVVAFRTTTPALQEYNCINCGACVESCPIRLVPSHFAKLVKNGKYNECERRNIRDCIECGNCSYICPSKINLVHYIKLGKNRIIAASGTMNRPKDVQ